ncbi:hypothetical protein P8452_70385 [Trifolium repens]|nr:hypothetical protein P8452_70385 [Trifolium repens]
MKRKKNANGRSSTSKEIYVETRTHKDGSFVNHKAARVIILMTSEDVNDILRAARQVTDASIAPDQTDSQSPYTVED